MIKVYRAADLAEANIIRGLLEAHGIDAFVSGHYLQGGVGDLPPLDLMSVNVNDEDEARARALVHAYESGALALSDDELPDSPPSSERPPK
jgi:hypothetical protein